MQTESLKETDSCRKNQCSCKGKRQSTVVGLLFALIIRPKKAQEKQNCCSCSRNRQSEKGRTERKNSASKTGGNDREKRSKIEE